MKFLIGLIVIAWLVSLGIPNFIDAYHMSETMRDSVCDSLNREVLPRGGIVLNQEGFQKCIENNEAHNAWMDTRNWIAGIVILAIVVGILIAIAKAKPTPNYLRDYDESSYSRTQGALPKDYNSNIDELTITKVENVIESDLQNNFSRFSWQQAEDLVGKLFEKKGYSVTIGVPTADGGTKRQGDFGIDVEAKNEKEYLGVQVKHWSMDVGFEDVAKTLGVAQKFNKVIIVSTKSGFTSQALEHAQKNPYLIELWDSNKFKNELRQHVISSTNIEKSKGALPKDTKNESG